MKKIFIISIFFCFFQAKGNTWCTIQENVCNAVVQIFVQAISTNILKPYETPQEKSGTGSGFIINEKGYIITNAHVVNQAIGIWIYIPSIGKHLMKVELVSIAPTKDLALLKISDFDLEFIKNKLGAIPYVALGNSDSLKKAENILTLGYPMPTSQSTLKITKGIFSGKAIINNQEMLQIDAAVNPGSSGCPVFNKAGKVIGITQSGIVEAQNIGYIIPVNRLKNALKHMYKIPLLHNTFLGLLTTNATISLTDYLGNPQPGGCYVIDVIKNSALEKAGVQKDDMIYEVNGYELDIYGEMSVEWSQDRIFIVDYIERLSIGDKVDMKVYRKGRLLSLTATICESDLPKIRAIYPGYEKIDYEIFAGMIVMQLNINHIQLFKNYAPGLLKYTQMNLQNESVLIITHIFNNCLLSRAQTISAGMVVEEINNQPVKTLQDFRSIIKSSLDDKHLLIKTMDTISSYSSSIFTVLAMQDVIHEEPQLAQIYGYPMSNLL